MNIHERIIHWQKDDGVKLFQKMHLPDNTVAVDFGVGFGEYSIALALTNASYKIYSIDKNKKVLKEVKDKIEKNKITNIELVETDGSLQINLPDNTADMVLMYDLIHGNTSDKLPIRFTLFQEAKRVLKPCGILSIAPFECEYLRDITGRKKKYTEGKLIAEIEDCGYQLKEKIEGAIHFDYYHSLYHWKKLNGDMPFDYLEKGYVLNFINNK